MGVGHLRLRNRHLPTHQPAFMHPLSEARHQAPGRHKGPSLHPACQLRGCRGFGGLRSGPGAPSDPEQKLNALLASPGLAFGLRLQHSGGVGATPPPQRSAPP